MQKPLIWESFVSEFIGLDDVKYADKSMVDMKEGVFIDDRADMLENSNAKIKEK